MSRSIQDLLAERRANIAELGRERNKAARASLQGHIQYLDVLIKDLQDEDRDWERAPTATYFDLSDEGGL